MIEPQGRALFQEIGYEAGFHREQGPTHLDLAARLGGVAGPDPARPYTYLELGCGQGTTVAVLAAANPECRFVANDINPEHVRNVRALATEGGLTNLAVLEADFAALAEADLPSFDVITLHGVWSWIGDQQRREIASLIRDRLAPGGLVYVSYNAMPGWAVAAPLQRFLDSVTNAQRGPVEARIRDTVALMETLRGSGAHYFAANPSASRWLESLAGKDTGYIVHEYLAGNFVAFYAPDVHAAMREAGASFAGTAHLVELSEEGGMPAAVRQSLAATPDRSLRTLIGDFFMNRQFRRDVFVKGDVPAPGAPRPPLDRRLPFALIRERTSCGLEVRMPGGGIHRLSPAFFAPLLDLLGRSPMSIDELVAAPGLDARDPVLFEQAMTMLVGVGHAAPCLPRASWAARRPSTDRFNRAVLKRITAGHPPDYLASPVLGSGVHVELVDALFLDAAASGKEPVGHAIGGLAALGRGVVRDGRIITDMAEARAELARLHRVHLAPGGSVVDPLAIAPA